VAIRRLTKSYGFRVKDSIWGDSGLGILLIDRMAMIRGEADMSLVAEHLSVAELEERYEACEDVTSSRHFQAIFLLAKGHSTREAAEITSFGQRWIEQLLERYNAVGPAALGDLRRDNGSQARVLKPELLDDFACSASIWVRRRRSGKHSDGRGGKMVVAARQHCKRYFVGAHYLSRRDNQDDALIVARVAGRPTPRAVSMASFRR